MNLKIAKSISYLLLLLLVLPGNFLHSKSEGLQEAVVTEKPVAAQAATIISIVTTASYQGNIQAPNLVSGHSDICGNEAGAALNPVQNTISQNLFALPADCFK